MRKTSFQIILPLLLVLSFFYGGLILYPHIYQVVWLVLSGYVPMTMSVIAALAFWVVFIAVHFCLLWAAYQIFTSGRWQMLRALLYLSIPVFNVFNLVDYTFSFGPYVPIYIQYASSLSFGFQALYFVPAYELVFSMTPQPVFIAGVNLMPIVWLWLLNRWQEKKCPQIEEALAVV